MANTLYIVLIVVGILVAILLLLWIFGGFGAHVTVNTNIYAQAYGYPQIETPLIHS